MSPSYTVRVHPRARHVRLRLDPREGLIVTVPPRFDQRRIPRLLAERSDWIDAVSRRHGGWRADCAPTLLGPRPQRVDLPAVGRSWALVYRSVDATQARVHDRGAQLELAVPAAPSGESDGLVAALLRRWLSRQARGFLGQELDGLARRHGLRYAALSIRHQRSRWGSCSATARISLNARLMFCPIDAVRYVLIHELVHTEHLNHSETFWLRVAELMPDYARARLSLNRVWQQLPDWA